MPYKVTQRQTVVFIAGLALGIGAAWAIFGRSAGEPRASVAPVASATAKSAPTAVAVAIGACDFKPVVTTAASDDGRVQLVSDLSGRGAKDIDAWILDGKEAVAAGRQKDAETDFLMACRAAEKLGDAGAMPQAEAMYHLGRHYAGLAGAAAAGRGGELWSRAESLFAASLQAYQGRYGESSDKTRFAAKGLAEAREHTGGAPAVATAAAPAKAAETKVAKVEAPKVVAPKVEAPREIAKAPAPAPAAAPAPAPAAAPKEPVIAKAPAPRAPEPAVLAAPKPPPAPVVAAAPPKAPEPPKVAVARPAPPKPRPAPAPVQEAEDRVVVEPPAAAEGNATSATGQAQGEATGSAQ